MLALLFNYLKNNELIFFVQFYNLTDTFGAIIVIVSYKPDHFSFSILYIINILKHDDS